MSDQPIPDEDLTRIVRTFMAEVRAEADKRKEHDVVDRVLAAASFVFAAVLIAWPGTKAVPTVPAFFANLARQLWRRRSWWV